MKNAGRIMPLPRGEYNSAVTYNLLDFVTHDGSSYICKKESMGNTPSENSEYWQLMARKGSSGGAVTGVKGNAETAYRQGNVNITKDNIGLNNVANERQYSALNPQPSVTGSSGSCTGNSATATKATQDKNGNDIVNTYATKTEMNAVKKSVSDGKTLVANAITAKGITTATDAEFATIATNIGRIQTGVNTSDATAVAANILSGKTAYVKGSKVTGTMAEKAGVTVDATATTQDSNYTYLNLPEGHYSATSKVRTPNSNIVKSYTAPACFVAGGTKWFINTEPYKKITITVSNSIFPTIYNYIIIQDATGKTIGSIKQNGTAIFDVVAYDFVAIFLSLQFNGQTGASATVTYKLE